MWTDTTRALHARTGLALPSDLTDAEWAVLEPFLPPTCFVGRPRKWSLRRILEPAASQDIENTHNNFESDSDSFVEINMKADLGVAVALLLRSSVGPANVPAKHPPGPRETDAFLGRVRPLLPARVLQRRSIKRSKPLRSCHRTVWDR